jgi:hypothetical protein
MKYVAPTPVYPGDTPAERYAWLMARLSRNELLDIAATAKQRAIWLRENSPHEAAA